MIAALAGRKILPAARSIVLCASGFLLLCTITPASSWTLRAQNSTPSATATSPNALDALDAEYAAQTGTAITIIFDNSGSMAGQKVKEAKQAFQWWLEKAPESYKWSLITFDKGGSIRVPFGGGTRQKVAAAVNGLTADTNTPIVRSLKLALKQIQDRRATASPYERHVVLLFTDGAENEDRGGNASVNKTILAMRVANVEVVGIGYHGEGDYMAGTASRYYQANNQDALRSGLGKVDAEVGLNDDVKVTPEDLQDMIKLPIDRPREKAVLSSEAPPADPPAPYSPPAASQGPSPSPFATQPASAPPAPNAPPPAPQPPAPPAPAPAPGSAPVSVEFLSRIIGATLGMVFCVGPILLIIVAMSFGSKKRRR